MDIGTKTNIQQTMVVMERDFRVPVESDIPLANKATMMAQDYMTAANMIP